MDPPNSSSTTKNVFLGGAGARGMEIEGEFVKFTAIGVYLEDNVSPSLAPKWKGKTAHELTNSIHFFRDIITGPFEKVARVTMLVPLTGKEYSEKVTENCVKHWKEVGAYSDDEAKAIEKFLEVFKDEKFEPDASILFTISPTGSLRISFSKDSSEAEVENGLIENKRLSEAILESMIGEHGVSPEAKDSLGVRISDLLKQYEGNKAIGKDKLEAEKDAVESLHQIDGETVEVAEVEM